MRSTLKYGLITGILMSIVAIGFYSIVGSLNWGIQASSIRLISGALTISILYSGMNIAVLAAKKEQHDTLTYQQAIKTGISIAAIAAVITAIVSFVYCTYINPGCAQYMFDGAQKDSVAIKDTYFTGVKVMVAFVAQFAGGMAMALIMGLFLRTKEIKLVSV